ncbi:hypothetical protein [Motiliproteus sediminis]|uniref:hypothetical protein n=1 Tax=Motiliproteus sediminis TaxID=1468178 RepID=UPI001FEBB893|nr:hypothetical protein [Motiliproteus sediminis]
MPDTPIGLMLQDWQRHVIEHHDKEEFPVPIACSDIVRVKALAEVYHLPLEEVIANLLASALQEVETRMPYVAGTNVIRVEEGEPVYEDVGLTPRYLAAKDRLEKLAKS